MSSNDNEIVVAAAGSTDQPGSDKEQDDVYVEVVVIAKELKRKGDGSIKAEQLLVSYVATEV